MAYVNLLFVELSLAPTLILVSSLVQQRWGQRIGGLIVGLPLTSLPLLMLLSLAHGAQFSAAAADSSLEASAVNLNHDCHHIFLQVIRIYDRPNV